MKEMGKWKTFKALMAERVSSFPHFLHFLISLGRQPGGVSGAGKTMMFPATFE